MAMNFSFVPSLKHRSLVKIAVSMFTHNDIQELMFLCPKINNGTLEPYSRANGRRYSRVNGRRSSRVTGSVDLQGSIELVKKELKKVENEVFKYVLKLPLPDVLKNDLLSVVEAVGWQLIKWREMHPQIEGAYKKNFTKFPWTPQGTIDRKKAAELYANDESIPVDVRYIIACESCLKDCIFILWQQLKECTYDEFKGIRKNTEKPSRLTTYWLRYVKGELHLLNEEVSLLRLFLPLFLLSENLSLNYKYMFISLLGNINVAAATYLFNELTPQEKEDNIVDLAERLVIRHDAARAGVFHHECKFDGEILADISVFFISKLNKEQQEEMFRQYPLYVLKCFLIWPRQIFFMDLAKLMFCCPPGISSDPILSYPIQYCIVLKMIASKIANGSVDFNYKKLFEEFWHESHHTYKRYVIDNYFSFDYDTVLSTVFKVKDTENIQLVLKDAFISRKRKSFCD